MENFISSSSSPLPLTMSHISTPSSSAAFDDASEDACSICLEPFGTDDPATITSCKHEYHLHCILEWSQRSKECPICWQLLILKDPASQELLTAVEAEKCLSSRTVHSHAFDNSRSPLERLNNDHDDSCSDDSDFDEQLMQHIVAAASRARYICRRERQRSPGAGPSEVLVFNTSMHASGMQPTLTTSPSGGTSPTFGVPSAAHNQPPTSAFSSVGMVATDTSSESDMPSKPRVVYSQPSPESARKLNTSEMFSFPESIKSKLSAASARCKESISKNTRGLKEKLIARNASVKELSKGVQREMNAGIAGVARMIERLDLKRPSSPLIPVKGKSVQENNNNVIEQLNSEESGALVGDVTSNASSLVGVEIPPSV
ncbi:E3 ubiquitin-protein ligase RHF1A isoform X2 [Cajanus cajan]|uniref:RING-type E3 ubiquitin transferase n=1 Tax=Cajanus cajan TaxID=3821 RepID=A0A151STS8_CAJCA|nr:E3 ubiquitin-protein ligase RHF1A isoform X2 [Cajanus cajan]KYP58203.1 E3 ubiquitin-protein ligase At3g02290 family [Cajanus cajan]